MKYPARSDIPEDILEICKIDISSVPHSSMNGLVEESTDHFAGDPEEFVKNLGDCFYLNMSIDNEAPGKLKIGFRERPSAGSKTLSYMELPPSTIAMAKELERENISLAEWCETLADMIFDAISVTTGFPRENMKFSLAKVHDSDFENEFRGIKNCWNLSKLIYEANGADWSGFAIFDD